jgi:hypothetical protein
MPTVPFTEWRPGLRKVSLDELIRDRASVGLADAKAIVDALLTGESPRVAIATLDDAEALIVEARALGAEAVLEEASG